MTENFANLASTKLTSPILIGDSSLQVESSASFPSSNFRIIIDCELIFVETVTGITWSILRGQENTIPAEHKSGDLITQVLTLQGLTNFVNQSKQEDKNLLAHLAGNGLESGGLLSVYSSTQFKISNGVAYFVDNTTDPANPTISKLEFPEIIVADEFLTSDRVTYVFIDSSGNHHQQNTLWSPETKDQFRNYVYLGRTLHSNYSSITGVFLLLIHC